jgi:hypothetical protein
MHGALEGAHMWLRVFEQLIDGFRVSSRPRAYLDLLSRQRELFGVFQLLDISADPLNRVRNQTMNLVLRETTAKAAYRLQAGQCFVEMLEFNLRYDRFIPPAMIVLWLMRNRSFESNHGIGIHQIRSRVYVRAEYHLAVFFSGSLVSLDVERRCNLRVISKGNTALETKSDRYNPLRFLFSEWRIVSASEE